MSHAKSLCLLNENVLDPLYDLLGESCYQGCSLGTTGLDLMPGSDSITVGQGMPFGGSLASLTLEKPCIVLQHIVEKLKVQWESARNIQLMVIGYLMLAKSVGWW